MTAQSIPYPFELSDNYVDTLQPEYFWDPRRGVQLQNGNQVVDVQNQGVNGSTSGDGLLFTSQAQQPVTLEDYNGFPVFKSSASNSAMAAGVTMNSAQTTVIAIAEVTEASDGDGRILSMRDVNNSTPDFQQPGGLIIARADGTLVNGEDFDQYGEIVMLGLRWDGANFTRWLNGVKTMDVPQVKQMASNGVSLFRRSGADSGWLRGARYAGLIMFNRALTDLEMQSLARHYASIGVIKSSPSLYARPAVAARYWRIRFTENHGDALYGLAGVRLFDEYGFFIKAFTPSASSSFSGFPHTNLYDDVKTSYWLSNNGDAQPTLTYDMGVPRKVSEIWLENWETFGPRIPRAFQVESSDDGVNWTPRLKRTGQRFWAIKETRKFRLGADIYRLRISATNGAAEPIVANFELRGAIGGPDLTTPVGTARGGRTGMSANSSTNYISRHQNIFDGNVATFSFTTALPVDYDWAFDRETPIAEFAITTRSPWGGAGEAPRDFKLQRSTDGGFTFGDLITIANESGWSAGETRAFSEDDLNIPTVDEWWSVDEGYNNNATTSSLEWTGKKSGVVLKQNSGGKPLYGASSLNGIPVASATANSRDAYANTAATSSEFMVGAVLALDASTIGFGRLISMCDYAAADDFNSPKGFGIMQSNTSANLLVASNGVTDTIPSPLGAWQILVVHWVGGERRIRLNGSVVATRAENIAFQWNFLQIFGMATSSGAPPRGNGKLAELRINSKAMTTAEVEQFEGTVAHKYGLASLLPSGHPYKNNPPA